MNADTSKNNEDKEKPKEPPAPMATFGEVFSFGEGRRKTICLTGGFLCAIVSGISLPAMAFFFAQVFEDLGSSTSNSDFLANIRELAFTFMILGVIVFASMTLQSTLFETAADIMTIDLRTKWFRALLRQDLAYYDIKDVSGTATIISTNGAKYRKGVGRKCGESVQYMFTFLGGFAYAFYSSWRASLVVLTVTPFMVASGLILVRINNSQTSRANASYAEAGSIVYTTVSSIRTILGLNLVEVMIHKFQTATKKAYDGAASQAHLVGLANGSIMGAFLLSYVAVTLYGAFILYDQVRSNGCDPSGTVKDNTTCGPSGVDVFGALMGITFAAAVLPQVAVALEALIGARAACYPAIVAMKRKLGEDDPEEAKKGDEEAHGRGSTTPLPKYEIDSSSETGQKLKSVDGTIEFNNVTFAYPTRPETNVFDNFSLKIPAGKTVALVGPSGSGKSTSVQLVERFYDPTAGSVMLDGHDLKDLNVKWLREQIGMVGQEPSLFACSIKENIAYGKPDANMEEIEMAARAANAHDFIMSFPEGYDTDVGDHGSQLSGGQKQRIAIARILVKKPKILLLDEATSALDSESESIVQQALDKLLETGSMTSLVIAHRLSTIRDADMIAVCVDGKIIETGTHDELLAKRGQYYDLVEAQKGKKNENDPASRSESFADLQGLVEEAKEGALLRFSDVHFRYPARPDNRIFRGLQLDVREGETLALVGPSGHGKSSVIQLIERFYDPDEGRVTFLDTDLKDVNVKYLRDQIGLVSQEPTLFDTTIAENIRYGRPDCSMQEIEDAAREANAYDFITEFPDGFDTMVGTGGTQVSGGQKQRIAIARAIIKKPRILLLDEATSALDSESEKVVQQALDKIMSSKKNTVVVIAHRLSTVRDADRIAVIVDGKVREIGTHDELMANTDGHYRKLHLYQDLDTDQVIKASITKDDPDTTKEAKKGSGGERLSVKDKELDEIDKAAQKENAKRAWLMAAQDRHFFLIGGVGAVLAGLIFPGWGFVFAYMIELLYHVVLPCVEGVFPPPPDFETCEDYWDNEADFMRDLSINVTYGYIGMIASTMIGFMLLFYGFNTASERMNKRVRDSAFQALIRQEVGYFDLRPVGVITSKFQEDAALLHAFSGEPIRTLIMNTSSVLVGLFVSFFFMWPFALLTLGILPFMAFGAEMEMKMYMGEDEGDDADGDEEIDGKSSGGIVVETLLNIRTVASLTVENKRATEYENKLLSEKPHPIRTNALKGSAAGLGQFVQMWGMALMFWWGGYLLITYPGAFTYRDFLISMFSLLFSLSGMAMAAQGATNRDKAKLAADRIFELIDRASEIDPLSESGKKDL